MKRLIILCTALLSHTSLADFPVIEKGDVVPNDSRLGRPIGESKEGELTIASFNIRNLAARKRNLKDFEVARLEARGPLQRPEIRLDIDYPQDGEFISKLMEAMDSNRGPNWTTMDVIEALDRNPELLELRRGAAESKGAGLAHA